MHVVSLNVSIRMSSISWDAISLISSIILFVLLLICNATENINQIIFVIPIGVLSGLIGTITGINIPRRK